MAKTVKRWKYIKPEPTEYDKLAFCLLRVLRGHETKDIAYASGLSLSCVRRLRLPGKDPLRTKHPRFETVTRAIHGCGLTLSDLLAEYEHQYPTKGYKKVPIFTGKPMTKLEKAKHEAAMAA
jgi:hypothetical protein